MGAASVRPAGPLACPTPSPPPSCCRQPAIRRSMPSSPSLAGRGDSRELLGRAPPRRHLVPFPLPRVPSFRLPGPSAVAFPRFARALGPVPRARSDRLDWCVCAVVPVARCGGAGAAPVPAGRLDGARFFCVLFGAFAASRASVFGTLPLPQAGRPRSQPRAGRSRYFAPDSALSSTHLTGSRPSCRRLPGPAGCGLRRAR